jgi:hypothetical protein
VLRVSHSDGAPPALYSVTVSATVTAPLPLAAEVVMWME